jgi:hypothetical protein
VQAFLILNLLLFRKSKYQPNKPWNKPRKSKYNLMMILMMHLILSLLLLLTNIPWYTEMEYCESNINGTVNPIEWSFKDEMGEDMSEDDDVGLERSVLDYFVACFPPNAMKNIMYLTNKKLEEDEQPEMEMGSYSSSLES